MSHAPRIAILTAHGQPSAPPPQEIHLAALAAAVQDHLPDWEIRSATLSSPGFLERTMSDGAVIYPFFMARGWFTGRALPARLKGHRFRMALPFGMDPALPEMTARALESECKRRDWAPADTEVLLAAHGSARGLKAAEAAEAFADQLRKAWPGARLSIGYVEQAPSIADAAQAHGPQSLCLPFFAQTGAHVRHDIPDALTQGGYRGHILPVLGALPETPSLIAAAIQRAKDTEHIS